MGFLEVLTIIFIILKVMGYIAWSWWLVFLPVIVSLGLYIVLIILFFTSFAWSWGKLTKSIDDAEVKINDLYKKEKDKW